MDCLFRFTEENASIAPETCQENSKLAMGRPLTIRPCPSSNLFDYLCEGGSVADVTIDDGIIRIKELDIQDPKAAKVLAEYPEARWAEITRRALKIGLGYLKGGAQE